MIDVVAQLFMTHLSLTLSTFLHPHAAICFSFLTSHSFHHPSTCSLSKSLYLCDYRKVHPGTHLLSFLIFMQLFVLGVAILGQDNARSGYRCGDIGETGQSILSRHLAVAGWGGAAESNLSFLRG